MNSDQEFAKGLYNLIVTFLSGIQTIDSLENYYKKNIGAIDSIKEIDLDLYKQLINKFKEERHAINTDPVRQELADKTAGGEGQVTPEQEDKLRREERTRQHRKSYPSAGLWKG
tara:strand:+ start:3112 stop:3453 length:342 start_codon:yes stop_codon:yes gene_type:complete